MHTLSGEDQQVHTVNTRTLTGTEQGGKAQFCIRWEGNTMEEAPELAQSPETPTRRTGEKEVERQELAGARDEGQKHRVCQRKGVEGTRAWQQTVKLNAKVKC